MLKYLRCQRNNLHVNGAQLTSHRTEDTAATKLTCIIQEHAGIVIEADVRTVSATDLLLRANNQSLRYCTLLNVTRRDCVLDSNDNHITYAGIATACTAEHTDAECLTCAAVVSNCKS